MLYDKIQQYWKQLWLYKITVNCRLIINNLKNVNLKLEEKRARKLRKVVDLLLMAKVERQIENHREEVIEI